MENEKKYVFDRKGKKYLICYSERTGKPYALDEERNRKFSVHDDLSLKYTHRNNLVRFDQLKPLQDRTPEERQAICRKSVEARIEKAKERRTFKEIMGLFLSAQVKAQGKPVNIEDVKNLEELIDKNMSADEKIIFEQIIKAVNGDTAASKFVAEIAGELKQNLSVKTDKPFEVNISVVNEEK